MKNRFFKVLLVLFFFCILVSPVEAKGGRAETTPKKTTSEEETRRCKDKNVSSECSIFGDPEDDGENYDPNGDCQASTAYFLQEIFTFIRYLGPALAIVLTIVEFVKAAADQNADALAKALKKTGWRVALVILLFFLPNLINISFSWFGWYGTCGIE